MSMKLEEFARESRATHKGDKSGVPIVGLEHLIPQEIKFSGYDVDTENTFTKTFKKGQILFGRRRAYLKKAAIADFDGICSGDITVIEAIPGKVDPLLLPFIIQNDKFFDYAVSRSAGGLSPRVKWEHLKDYEFDLPPIEEQRILADKLWAAYRLKESYKKLLTATQEMVKSQFFEMFEGDEYPLIKLGDYTDLTWGDTNTTKNSYVTEGYLAYSASGPDGKLDHYDYDCEGIVLSAIGADCGKTWFASGKWSCIKNTIRFWSTFDDLDNRFLYFATREKDFWPRRGGAQPFIPQGDARNCSIPLPPICLQRKFVEIAEQADKSEFVGCKSQFIEMFGDTHMRSDHSRQWKEVVEIINGKDYKSIQVEDGGYPVYGTGGEMARASDYLSPANSILLGRKGTIDKPLLIREKYWNVDTAFGAVPDEKVLHYVYFYWHCKTIDFNVLNKGTTLPSTTKVDLLNLWIKIPSMEEQTRFGSIVEQADKSEFVGCKSQFIEMFEGEKYPRLSLDEICKEWSKGQGFKKDDICEDGETQCIHYGELFTKYGPVINEVISRTSVEKKKTSKKGDILFPASDVTPNGLARCSMLPFDNVILGGDIIILRPKDKYNPAYLSYAINQQTSQLLTRVNGGVVKHMSAKGLKTVEIPIPPMDKQGEYIQIAEQADKSEYYN